MAKKENKEKIEKEEKKEEKKPSNVFEYEIKIDGDVWKNAIDKVFEKRQKTVKVDGFRKGKVPRSIYEKRFGKESLFFEAADIVVENAYIEAIKQCPEAPIVKPAVELKDINENECVFNFKIVSRPEVKIKKYKGLNIKPKEVEVADEEVEHELGHLLERYTELVAKDEKAKVENGDVAIIDFEGFKDGVAFDGGKGENYSLEIGSNTFIPGFEEKIIGMKAGEEKDLDLTFPEEYGAPDLAGKDVVFKVKVNEIKVKQNRELDEDFFDDLGIEGVDSEKKLKEHIKDEIKKHKEFEAENDYVDELLEEVSKNVEINIPEELVEEEIDRLMHRFEDQMKSQGISLDIYYQFSGTTEKDLRAQMEKEAYSNVLYRFMLEEIIKEENIEATDKEIDEKVEELAKGYNVSKEEFINGIGGTENVKLDIQMHKAIELLKELNK